MQRKQAMSSAPKRHPIVDSLSRVLLRDEERLRILGLRFADAGHGYDAFGLSREWVALGAGLTRGWYEHYFRVQTIGAEHIPKSGAAIIVANHSGAIPIDAAMLWADVLRNTDPPRVLRPVMDHFVPLMPFISVFFARVGAIGGSRGNVEHLLDAGEVLAIFPEGVTGIAKSFRRRYQIQDWRVGHVELAIRHHAPIVPAAIIGPEEQFIQFGKTGFGAKALGAPFIPLTVSPVPLPVHYAIEYGAPIVLHERYKNADDPIALERAAIETKDAVERLISAGLTRRRGVFA
jgi:1-acyl-sn-glycerol-3-phosphate acyltransferase